MKAVEVRNRDVAGLRSELMQLRKERFNLRFQQATGQLESTARVRQVRRDIARIKTVLAEKERAAAAAPAGGARA